MQGGATLNTGLSENSTSLRQRQYLSHERKNNYQQQHKQTIQQIPPPLGNGKTRATDEKTTLNNSKNHFFVF